jgi:hypothetical protein
MTSTNNLFDGVAVAVFAVVLVAFLAGFASPIVFVGLPHTDADAMGAISLAFGIGCVAALVTLPFAIISALVIGVPLFLYWRRRGFTSVAMYFLAGAIISGVLAVALALAHAVAGFLTGGFDFPLALSIIVLGGPVAALTVRSFAGLGAK